MIKQDNLREEFTLRETFTFLRHQKWLYAATLLVALLIWAFMTFTTTPIYQATSVVQVEGRVSNGGDGGDVLDVFTLENNTQDIVSLIEVMRGQVVLTKAFGAANLTLPPPGSDVPRPDIQVQQVGNTRVVQINVLWSNAQEAQAIAAQIPIAYNEYVYNTRVALIDRAQRPLDERLKAEQRALQTAESKLEEFDRQRPGLSPENASGELSERATALELTSRSADLALEAAKKRYDSLLAAQATIPPTVKTDTVATNLQRRETAKQQLEGMLIQRRGLLATYTAKSPEVQAVNDQIATQRAIIMSIPAIVNTKVDTRNPQLDQYKTQVDTARADYEGALASASTAKANVAAARVQVEEQAKRGPARSILLRNIASHQEALKKATDSRDILALRQRSLRPAASIVTDAFVADKPIKPRPVLYLAISLISWAVLGTGLALLREQVDDRVLAVEDAYRLVDSLPTMGMVPTLGTRRTLLARSDDPEAYNNLRLLRFGISEFVTNPDKRSVAVVSAGRREGRTTLATNLASQLASDRPTILVDGDFTRPRIARAFGVPDSPGLAEVLLGRAEIESALQTSPKRPNLRILPAGTAVEEAAELLGSEKMREALGRLEGMADVVVIDTMPMLGSADASEMASLADGALLAVRLGFTKRGAVSAVVQRLGIVQANVLGFVFTRAQRGR